MTRFHVPAALGAVTYLASAATALAAPGGEETPVNLAEEGGRATSAGGGNLVRTFVGLAIVLAVIYGLHWVLKQVKASREERSSGQGLVPLASLGLGANRALHVVKAGNEVVVLGVAEHGIVPIRTYTEEEALEAGLLPEEAAEVEEGPTLGARALGALSAVRGAAASAREAQAGRARPSLRDGGGLVETLRAWTVRG